MANDCQHTCRLANSKLEVYITTRYYKQIRITLVHDYVFYKQQESPMGILTGRSDPLHP